MPLRHFAKIDPVTGHVDSVAWSDYPADMPTPDGLRDVSDHPEASTLGGRVWNGAEFVAAPPPKPRKKKKPARRRTK